MIAVEIPPFNMVAVFDRMRISCQCQRGGVAYGRHYKEFYPWEMGSCLNGRDL
jgi:hypothetical protein